MDICLLDDCGFTDHGTPSPDVEQAIFPAYFNHVYTKFATREHFTNRNESLSYCNDTCNFFGGELQILRYLL